MSKRHRHVWRRLPRDEFTIVGASGERMDAFNVECECGEKAWMHGSPGPEWRRALVKG